MEREFLMPIPIEEIKKLIISGIPDANIEIKDLMCDNNHYSAVIKSKKFKESKKGPGKIPYQHRRDILKFSK